MKLIREEIESAKVVITEGKNGKKSHFIEGVFLQGAIKNRNGRMYPMSVFQTYIHEWTDRKDGAISELLFWGTISLYLFSKPKERNSP